MNGLLPTVDECPELTAVTVRQHLAFFDDAGFAECPDLPSDLVFADCLLVLGTALRVRAAADIVADFTGHRIMVTNDPSARLVPRRQPPREHALV